MNKLVDISRPLTGSRLEEILDYDSETGIFSWKDRKFSRMSAGDKAGTLRNGYRLIRIDDVAYSAHRLAWLWIHGTFPSSFIDHKNGNRDDNRIENLRLCTNSENLQNQRTDKNNSSGIKGVTWSNGRQKWVAQIRRNGRGRTIGFFDNKEDAAKAYSDAALKEFGEFARVHVVS